MTVFSFLFSFDKISVTASSDDPSEDEEEEEEDTLDDDVSNDTWRGKLNFIKFNIYIFHAHFENAMWKQKIGL